MQLYEFEEVKATEATHARLSTILILQIYIVFRYLVERTYIPTDSVHSYEELKKFRVRILSVCDGVAIVNH